MKRAVLDSLIIAREYSIKLALLSASFALSLSIIDVINTILKTDFKRMQITESLASNTPNITWLVLRAGQITLLLISILMVLSYAIEYEEKGVIKPILATTLTIIIALI